MVRGLTPASIAMGVGEEIVEKKAEDVLRKQVEKSLEERESSDNSNNNSSNNNSIASGSSNNSLDNSSNTNSDNSNNDSNNSGISGEGNRFINGSKQLGGFTLRKLSSVAAILFWLSIGFQVFDWLVLGFGRNLNSLLVGTILAFVITFLLTIFFSEGNFIERLMILLIPTLVTAWAPFIISLIVNISPSLRFIYGIYAFMPPWALFILFSAPEKSGFSSFKKFYIGFWILLLAFFLIINLPNFSAKGIGGDATGVDDFTNQVSDIFTGGWDKITDTYHNTQQRLNGSLDPTYYSGQVEQNSQKRLGVRFEDVRTVDPIFFETDEPLIYGYVTADSFLRESIWVVPSCRITRKGDYPTAVVDPVQSEVFVGQSGAFECKFPPMVKGSYPVEVGATFDFDTWADMTYTFVLEDRVRTYAFSNKNVNTELKIPNDPVAIYTDGPVRIGMGGSKMPVLITKEAPYLKNAYLGITIESQWKGELNDVESVELKIPNAFTLTDCNRGDPIVTSDPEVPNYDNYLFTNIMQKGVAYTTLRCKLGLQDPTYFTELGNVDEAERTFIATTKYKYTIKENLNLMVK